MNLTTYKVYAYAKIDGVKVDVSGFATNHELNAIPECSVSIPVGRNMHTGQYSAIHQIADRLNVMLPLELYLKLEKVTQSKDEEDFFPEGEFRVFNGFATGAYPFRTSESAGFTVRGINHLYNVNSGSCLSSVSHPQNPSHYTYQAATFAPGAGTISAWSPFSKNNVLSGAILSDFWEGGIRTVFEDLASTDYFVKDIFPEEVEGDDGPRKKVLAELATIKNGVPLALKTKGADAEALGDSVTASVLKMAYESFIHQSFWEKLIGEFCPSYLLAVVPRVEDTLVIPFTPGYRTPYKTILAKDTDQLAPASELKNPLQAIGILGNVRSETGFDLRNAGDVGIAGFYRAESVKTGKVLLLEGPSWLSRPLTEYRYTDKSLGGGKTHIATAFAPGEGGGEEEDVDPKAIIESNKTLINDYAHSVYVVQAIRSRQASIRNKVRFDIAPGSTVRIQNVGEKFLASDQAAQNYYGEVVKVSTSVDCMNNQAHTTFHVAYLRSEAENGSEDTSLAENPIWTTTFPGTGLLDE